MILFDASSLAVALLRTPPHPRAPQLAPLIGHSMLLTKCTITFSYIVSTNHKCRLRIPRVRVDMYLKKKTNGLKGMCTFKELKLEVYVDSMGLGVQRDPIS